MSFRFMRVIVFFDLPVETAEEKRAYRAFRKYLIGEGFLMMQESVYSKLTLNAVSATSVMKSVKKNCPAKGLVQMLLITEKQYSNIEILVGASKSEVINTTDKLVVL